MLFVQWYETKNEEAKISSTVAQAYNGNLRTEPPAWSMSRAIGQGA